MALLVTGAEYLNGSPGVQPVSAVYGSGCGQMLSHFDSLDTPQAMIGGTDIAVRSHLPPDILGVTVTWSMLEQLLALDGDSFMHKIFWKKFRKERAA